MTQENIINNETNQNKGFIDTTANCIGTTVGFFEAIKFPCVLASIAATVGFILATSLSNLKFFAVLGTILWVLGMAAALLSGPWKYIKMFFMFTFKGWHFGWVICPFIPACFVTAAIGAGLGIMLAMVLTFIVPAIVGLYYVFKD